MGRHTHWDRSTGGYQYTHENIRSIGPLVTRCPGMPAAMNLVSDWHFRKHEFDTAGQIPTDGTSWTITLTGANTIALSDDVFPPHLVITNAAADNDETVMQWTAADAGGEFVDFTAPGREHYFEIMARITDASVGTDGDAVEQSEWFFGWANTDTTPLAGAADFIGFRKMDANEAGGTLPATSGNGTVITVANDEIYTVSDVAGGAEMLLGGYAGTNLWDMDITTSAIAVADTAAGRLARRNARHIGPNDWFKLAMKVQPGADIATTNTGVAYSYINDEAQATHNLTDYVPNQNMCLTVAFQNAEAVAKVLNIAYIMEAVKYTAPEGEAPWTPGVLVA